MKIIISGGGTAGHINPALAVAQQLRTLGHTILFVGADGKMEMERVPAEGFEIIGLPIVGIQRKLTLSNLAVPFKLFKSIRRAAAIICEFKPDVVVGFGGYASAPILKAAQKRGIRTIIQEQNSYAGLTNKMLAQKAEFICVAYSGMEKFFPVSKIVHTGNPLRGALYTLPPRDRAVEFFGLDAAKKTILVVGGSLGTRTLNEMVIASTLPHDVQMIWQCGKYYYPEMLERAAAKNPRAYLERMDLAYAAADVIITRAGASTVSELQLIGKATIFVPSPNVAEDHQMKNAQSLVEVGAAIMVSDFAAIQSAIPCAIELMSDPAKMELMAAAQRAMGRPHAAQEIAQIVVNTPNYK